MTFYQFPRPLIQSLIFDMDNTLYTNGAYEEHQIQVQIEGAARYLGKPPEVFRAELHHFQTDWSTRHGGKKISLANSLLALGVPFSEILRFRAEYIQPEAFLQEDPALRATFARLVPSYKLAVVTNNPENIARRTLSVLGVAPSVVAIVGIDRAGVSKPHERPLQLVLDDLQVQPQGCVAIGDRFDIDIALPLQMGMGGILVEGVQEVYHLPELLKEEPHKKGPLCSSEGSPAGYGFEPVIHQEE
ncbi:MAG TPA: HAD family hydrolase [Termitinemataceae bacterium]|nr:HAD family hydrolase [Termitinemataceae bacterium]HOM24261.1 HAD family hydrolase [Termitinemataceae bacterium]HPQ00944.1 HAD family hydrolase [Termitinemataceae bacterium]